jgi:hypothetical protein
VVVVIGEEISAVGEDWVDQFQLHQAV